LKHSLGKSQSQKTDEVFSYSIIIVDNDHTECGEKPVSEIKKKASVIMEFARVTFGEIRFKKVLWETAY